MEPRPPADLRLHTAEAATSDVTERKPTATELADIFAAASIQILINNAGIHADAVFSSMSGEQWDSVIDVSLNGVFNVSRPLILPMIRTRWGRVVNVSSIAALTGNRGLVNNSAFKGALHAASKSLALQVEVAGRDITVNAVAPEIIDLGMVDGSFDGATVRTLARMQRAGKPEEVADLVGFLASEQAADLSGHMISINGAPIWSFS